MRGVRDYMNSGATLINCGRFLVSQYVFNLCIRGYCPLVISYPYYNNLRVSTFLFDAVTPRIEGF